MLKANSSSNIELQPTQLIQGQKQNDHFTCCICRNIVWDPQQCQKCEVLICEMCIVQSKQISAKCPQCREIFLSNKIGRFTKNTLNALKFKCTKCAKNFAYEKANEHPCLTPDIACILKCNTQTQIKNFNQMEQHLRFECLNVQVQCRRCEVKLKRSKFQNHSCEDGLYNLVNSLCAQIKNVKDSEIQKEQYNENWLKKRDEKQRLKANEMFQKCNYMYQVTNKTLQRLQTCCSAQNCCNKNQESKSFISENVIQKGLIQEFAQKESDVLSMIQASQVQRTSTKETHFSTLFEWSKQRAQAQEELEILNCNKNILEPLQLDQESIVNQQHALQRQQQEMQDLDRQLSLIDDEEESDRQSSDEEQNSDEENIDLAEEQQVSEISESQSNHTDRMLGLLRRFRQRRIRLRRIESDSSEQQNLDSQSNHESGINAITSPIVQSTSEDNMEELKLEEIQEFFENHQI